MIAKYTVPTAKIGSIVYDLLRGRNARVSCYHETDLGMWPAAGRKQSRPIIDAEMLRAILTEAAQDVARAWRVNIRTVVRWRAMATDNPRSIKGTTKALSDSTLRQMEDEKRRTQLHGIVTSRPTVPSKKAMKLRKWRQFPGGPKGRPPSGKAGHDAGVYLLECAVGKTPSGEIIWNVRCKECGEAKAMTHGHAARTKKCRHKAKVI